jgi:DNA-binding IclR family transcriptional regulator
MEEREENGASSKTGTSALHIGIYVLQAFSREEPVLGVNEISRRLQLHKSTVSRILATLEETSLVERDPASGRFRLGIGVIALAGPMLANMDVRRVARPFLEELSRESGETVVLTVWSVQETISVEQAASPLKVKHTSPVGTRYPEHASSSVRVFLAENPEEAQKFVDRGLERLTELTTVDPNAFLEDLRQVLESGYAVNDGETSLEETGISAPVRDDRDRVIAAVLLTAPRYRVPADRIESLGQMVKHAAERISIHLGSHVDVQGSQQPDG